MILNLYKICKNNHCMFTMAALFRPSMSTSKEHLLSSDCELRAAREFGRRAVGLPFLSHPGGWLGLWELAVVFELSLAMLRRPAKAWIYRAGESPASFPPTFCG